MRMNRWNQPRFNNNEPVLFTDLPREISLEIWKFVVEMRGEEIATKFRGAHEFDFQEVVTDLGDLVERVSSKITKKLWKRRNYHMQGSSKYSTELYWEHTECLACKRFECETAECLMHISKYKKMLREPRAHNSKYCSVCEN